MKVNIVEEGEKAIASVSKAAPALNGVSTVMNILAAAVTVVCGIVSIRNNSISTESSNDISETAQE